MELPFFEITVMKFKLVLSLFIFTIIQLRGQENLIEQANQFAKEKKLEESLNTFSKAFEKEQVSARAYFDAACIAAELDDSKKAFSLLQKSANEGWVLMEYTLRKKELRDLHEEPLWKDFIASVRANVEEMEKHYDQKLKTKLQEFYYRDQVLRQLYKEAEEKFGKDSQYMKQFWAVMSREDRFLEAEVFAIIEERGWPGRSLVGGQANSAVFMVLQHATLEEQEKYLPYMKESVLAGESSANQLAMLTDRVLVGQGKKQLYGSQFDRDPETGVRSLKPVEDPVNLNKRRIEIGLSPLEDYLKKYNIEWSYN